MKSQSTILKLFNNVDEVNKFSKFAESEYSSENVEVLKKILELKKSPRDTQKSLFDEIVSQFVVGDDCLLNISDKCKRIVKAYESHDQMLLAVGYLEHEICDNLLDTYNRFSKV